MSKHIYVVLGMPRSGTSAVARSLKALGVDLGNHLTPANQRWNPKGFWEDNEIVYKVNAQVMATLEHPWESIKYIDKELFRNSTFDPLKRYAKKLLLNRFKETNHWGFKDPNTAKLLAFWRSVFTELSLNEHYIIALRNPLSSAKSYHQLTGIDVEHSLLRWMVSTYHAIEETQHKNRIVVSYENLLENSEKSLMRLGEELQLTSSLESEDVEHYRNHFLDKSLKHYAYKREDFENHPIIKASPLCIQMYDMLLKLATDQMRFTDPSFAQEWKLIKQSFKQLYPMYAYLDSVLCRHMYMQKSLRTLEKSRLWKIIYPLRKLDHALRTRRKKNHQRKLAKMYEE